MIHILQAYNVVKTEPITKGWSRDQKYYLETADQGKLMLRISDIREFEQKKKEYEILKIVSALDIPMSMPLEFGVCNDGKSVYSLLSWVEGIDAEVRVSSLSKTEQYDLGVKAGKLLKIIHSLPAPQNLEKWETRFNRKLDKKIAAYYQCPIQINGDEKILSYIEKHRHLLSGRPQTFQHGDYHIGNLIVSDSGELSVIDFNRFDYGDPWEEFNRIVWCAQCSPYFASGRINGYFSDRVPEEFFPLLALYISSNALSSVPWAIPFGQGEIDIMIHQIEGILEYFNGMENPIPTWYIRNK